MSSVQALINQQLGHRKLVYYDTALERLICRKDEIFQSISLSEGLFQTIADPPIFACKFADVKGFEQILALANEDGKIAICDIKNRGKRYDAIVHPNAIFDIAWMPKKMKLISASGDYTAALFDVGNGRISAEHVFRGHTRSLKCIACRVDDYSVFATGARDGKILIWDVRSPKIGLDCVPDVLLPCSHYHPTPVSKVKTKTGKFLDVASGSSSVTGLVFQDYYNLISCGAGDGFIKVWDMRKTYYAKNRAPAPKYKLPYAGNTWRNGFSNLLINTNGTKLYANCLDNVIYCYNISTYNETPVMQYTGHINSTFYVKASLSPDDRYLLSGSSDNDAYIWRTDTSEPLLKLSGHEAEVTCVTWCKDSSNIIVTCSDDLRHKIWRVGPEVVPDSIETEFANRATKLSKKIKLNNGEKRSIEEPDENMFFDCNQLDCERYNLPFAKRHTCFRRLYVDEVSMISRNKAGFTQSMIKKQKMELENKRGYLISLDQNVTSGSHNLSDSDEVETPKKRLKRSEDFDISVKDMTENLPNFVLDGSAPHLNNSPLKKRDTDWLTKLRMERLSTKQLQEVSSPTSNKLPKLDLSNGNKKTTDIENSSQS